MIELQEIKKDKIEVVATKPVRSELKYLGSFRPKPGQTCYEFNLSTRRINPAEFDEINTDLKGGIRKKIIIKKNCLYACALNIKSSVKHFQKIINTTSHAS